MYIRGYTLPRRQVVNIENIYTNTFTLGGGFFASFLTGYFIRKVIKILMFVLGGILALLTYLQFQELIDVHIKLDRIQNSAEAIINTVAANATAIFSNGNDPSFMENNLGLPMGGSTAGFVLGITRRG